MFLAKMIDGVISISEQLLRRRCRADQSTRNDASGPEKRPLVLPRHGDISHRLS